MKKETFSSILNDKIHDFAFIWLLKKKKARISKNAKGKDLKYQKFEMA